jgi:hypothetical protein
MGGGPGLFTPEKRHPIKLNSAYQTNNKPLKGAFMETLLLKQLLDERNAGIWHQANKVFQVRVQLHNRAHHYYQINRNNADIFLGANQYSIEAFTHELLHIYLRSKNISMTEYLLQRLREEPLLHWTFTETLFEQIGHYLEHKHMLGPYLEAGFDRSTFLPDFNTPVCNPILLQLIASGLHKNIPSIISTDLFIRTFFRIRCHPDKRIHYGFYLESLKALNAMLFAILERFWEAWHHYDIDRYHPAHYSYAPFTATFMHELGAWAILAIQAKQKRKIICLI